MADSVKQPELYQWQNTVNTKQMKMLDLIDLDFRVRNLPVYVVLPGSRFPYLRPVIEVAV